MKHLYVFGAGASAASASVPLGRDLVWNYHSDCGLLVPFDESGPDLREENDNFAHFTRFLKLAASIYPDLEGLPQKWENSGMRLFDLYRSVKKRHYIDEMLETLHQKGNTEGVELVRRLIFEHLTESSVGRKNLLYKRFIKRVLKDTPSEHLAIISFNFDVLLYEDFEAGVYFDYLLDFDWMDHNREKIYARNNPIKLLKLNGSLDWGICPSCNRLHLYFPPMSRRFFDDKRCSEQCVGRIQPFIIIPHEKYKQQIEQLWSSAEEELKRAATVTVIGYSFPQYDEKVAQIFSKSLRPRTRLLVVDHCDRLEDKSAKEKAIRDKYRKLFPMLEGEIELYLNGFSGYVDTQTN